MEPDHCANIEELMRRYPNMEVVANQKTMQMIGQFFDISTEGRTVLVKEGDELNTGSHTLRFLMAPMVHWPEVMVTYDEKDKVLFSADAFGTFGALNGNIFNDEIDFEKDWLWVPEDTMRISLENMDCRYRRCLRKRLRWISG